MNNTDTGCGGNIFFKHFDPLQHFVCHNFTCLFHWLKDQQQQNQEYPTSLKTTGRCR